MRWRADTWADSTEIGPFDSLVQLDRVSPKRFVAEGVEREDLLSLLNLECGIFNHRIMFSRSARRICEERVSATGPAINKTPRATTASKRTFVWVMGQLLKGWR